MATQPRSRIGTRRILTGLHQISLSGVNAFLVDGGVDGFILIDTGVPGSAKKILASLRSIGRMPEDVKHILVTHAHADHTGSLAQLRGLTGARVYMHAYDAMLVQTGRVMRRMTTPPGLLNALMRRMLTGAFPSQVEPVKADELVSDRDTIPIAGGISVIHTPGHTEGHVAFLVHELRTLFVGDAAANVLGLRLMPIYEHVRQGRMSLRKLAGFDFETACFGHGPTIQRGASRAFRRKWGGPVR